MKPIWCFLINKKECSMTVLGSEDLGELDDSVVVDDLVKVDSRWILVKVDSDDLVTWETSSNNLWEVCDDEGLAIGREKAVISNYNSV